MPAYGSATPITHNPGTGAAVWNNETLALPAQSKSLPIFMRRTPLPNCLSVEVQFGGAPGAFQIDVEVADTDAEGFYVKLPTNLTALGTAANVGRLEFTGLVAKFARLRMVSRTNSVPVTAKFF